jgi:hypothetical protein
LSFAFLIPLVFAANFAANFFDLNFFPISANFFDLTLFAANFLPLFLPPVMNWSFPKTSLRVLFNELLVKLNDEVWGKGLQRELQAISTTFRAVPVDDLEGLPVLELPWLSCQGPALRWGLLQDLQQLRGDQVRLAVDLHLEDRHLHGFSAHLELVIYDELIIS